MAKNPFTQVDMKLTNRNPQALLFPGVPPFSFTFSMSSGPSKEE